jgi:predicted dehydrogenase
VTIQSNRQLRWGILSTSSFAEKVFIPGLRRSASVDLAAVASRDLEKAQSYARKNNIATAYGSYDDLLADPSIDVVYIPMPNTMHVEWAVKAAQAGKHVLCEKPIGMNAHELDALLPWANTVHIAEAFMVRFHPQWVETREVVRSGSLGRTTHMHIEFNYSNTDPTNIRNTAGVGGGAMYDIGCYAVVAARWFLEADPTRVAAVTDIDPVFGTDRLTSALLDFGDGRTCTFSVSTQTVPHQRVHLLGTQGRLEITIPFNQPQTDTTTYFVHHGQSLDGLDAEPHVLPAYDQYALQADAFCERIINEQPTDTHLRDAMVNMATIDAVFRAAQSGRFEPIV